MRAVVTTLILAGLAGIGFGIGHWQYSRVQIGTKVEQTRAAVDRLQRELTVRSATKAVELNERGFPSAIAPEWFADEDPVNRLLSDHHPWLEIAGPEEADLEHPAMRIALSEELAGLWYNPYRGVVRARVPTTVSDAEALMLYNAINSSALPEIFWAEPPVKHSTPGPESVESAQQGAGDGASSTPTGDAEPSQHAGDAPPKASPMRRRPGRSKSVIVVHRRPSQTQTEPSQTTDATPPRE